MPNIHAPNVEYFESFAREIQSKFQRVRKLVSHNTSSGDYHEEIIRTVLKNFFSKRFSVKKGFIYDGEGRVSQQIDILIIDETSPIPYLFQEGDFAIVRPDVVVGIIEVKTTLGFQQFKQGVDNIVSAKRLLEFPAFCPAFIFGYQGVKAEPKTLDHWFKGVTLVEDNSEWAPNGIIFFDDGAMLTQYTEDRKPQHGGKVYHKVYRSSEGNDNAWQLSLMLSMLVSSGERMEAIRTKSFGKGAGVKLVQPEGGMTGIDRFVFGKGLLI